MIGLFSNKKFYYDYTIFKKVFSTENLQFLKRNSFYYDSHSELGKTRLFFIQFLEIYITFSLVYI